MQSNLKNRIDKSPLKLSVLMPVYNAEIYLAEAIKSVLTQTYHDFEVVIVDDGSTDSSPDILERFSKSDPRIHVIRQKNKGIVAALNKGLQQCHGAYIARMDADDICFPSRFEEQITYLDNHPDCVMVGGEAQIINGDGVIISSETGEVGRRHAFTNMRRFPPKVVDSIHPLIMMRSKALRAIDGYRGNFPHAEDYDLFIRLSSQGTLTNPDILMLKYRVHETSLSQKNMREQEYSAAMSEITAMWSLREIGSVNSPSLLPTEAVLLKGAKISQTAFNTYVNYRLWKRMGISHLHESRKIQHQMLRAVFTLAPHTFFDLSYWRIRFHIMATFGYRLIKNLKH